MSGLELLEAMLAGALPGPPIAELMGFSAVLVEEGRVVFASEPGPQHFNPIGSVHGGFAATLLDSAMGCAVHSTLPAGTGYSTLDISVRYLRPMGVDTGRVECEGRIVHRGRRTATAEGRLTRASDGALVATGTTSCIVLAP